MLEFHLITHLVYFHYCEIFVFRSSVQEDHENEWLKVDMCI